MSISLRRLGWLATASLAVSLTVVADPPNPAHTLLLDTFEAADSLERWQPMVGATTGSGPASVVEWQGGAVRLSGDRDTRVWAALTREVAVGDASWLRLTGRVRAEGVDPAAARYRNCNLFLNLGGSIVVTQFVTGTTDWTELRRRVELPAGTERVTVGILLSMPGVAWFDDVALEAVEPPPWNDVTIGHYTYRTLPGDAIAPLSVAYNEASWELVADYLGVTGPSPVTYVKYPDRETKAELTGNAGNAHRSGAVIHTIWETDRHEIVHVLADAWGDPPALIAEGLAVHLSGGWQGRAVRAYAAGVLAAGDWIALDQLAASIDFRTHPDLVSYAIAGAFVAWIEASHGPAAVRQLYGELVNNGPAAANRAALERALGASLPELDAQLRTWLAR